VEVKKPAAVVQYNKLMKGIDRADRYLGYYSVLRKTVKWSKKVVLYLLNCALFNAFVVYRTLNTNKKLKFKNFLHELARSWISKVQNLGKTSSGEPQLPEKQKTPTAPKQYRPGRLSGDFRTHKLEKLLVVGREKGSILQDSAKCVLRITNVVKTDTFVNTVLFRFTKGLVLRNTVQ
jgi:hypothetical protein